MDVNTRKYQNIKIFLFQVVSYIMIFGILGAIISSTYSQNVYKNSDVVLNHYAKEINLWVASFYEDSNNKEKILTDLENPIYMDPAGRLQILLFDADGQLLNEENLPVNYPVAKSIVSFKFDRRDVNKEPKTVKIGHEYYRMRMIRLPYLFKSANKKQTIRYAVLLKNFSDGKENIDSFLNILIWSFVLFCILALTISWHVSKQIMKPVLIAWQKQQDFVNAAAHELKTPLAIIQSKLEALLSKPKETIRDQSHMIILSLSEIRRLTALTENMLTLAKVGSQMQLERKETELKSFINQVVEPYIDVGLAENKKVIIDVQNNGVVYIDRARVHQLLVLLLDNALKYSDDGAEIKLIARIEKNKLHLEVSDTGIGISDEAKKHIFDRFYREEKSGSRETGGTGLGLSIVDWIVKAFDGNITVKDNVPRGTIFIITLPKIK